MTTADEKSEPNHVPLPHGAPAEGSTEGLTDNGIPEWAPPLPTRAPAFPAPARPEPSRELVREPRGDDWWTNPSDPHSPWSSPKSLTPPEPEESAAQEHETTPRDERPGDPDAPGPVTKESTGQPEGRDSVGQQLREGFTPVIAELRDLRGRFERPYVPGDDPAENAKLLRRMRIRRYGIPLGIALVPIPPFLPGIGPVLGGYSLASTYASIPQSLQADSGWSLGWAAASAVVSTSVVVVRFAHHLKARREPGFTLRVATSAMVCGSVMYGPVGAYVLYLMNGYIA